MPTISNFKENGYRTLILDSNQISDILSGSLPTGILEISMNNNPIATIDNDTFNELSETLETLFFSNANFTRIPDAFLRLNGLKLLCIQDTQIIDWNVEVLAHIGRTLQTLILENVGLAAWPVWLKNLSSLIELNIVSSNLSTMPDNAFDNLANTLLTLTLSDNDFTHVPKCLSILKHLIALDLQDNKIYNITWLPKSNRLSDLVLNNNNIFEAENVSNALRGYENSLVSLTLSFNKLSEIPNLSYMTNIRSLDLSHNEIADIYSDSLPSSIEELNLSHNLFMLIPTTYRNLTFLRHMYLSHNTIQEFQASDIPSWITDVDLSSNLVTELSRGCFSNNSGLRVLNLDNNPIATITKPAFKNLGSLVSLSLKNTKLTRLPLSLAYLTNIRHVDLSNNPHLVCTCQEDSLSDTILSNIQLSGNCGSISIYNFYATLDLTCP
ncbi:hypothetical protein BsWGS_23824 [Bradybaena similaris]